MTDSSKQRIFIGVPVDGVAQGRINRLLKPMRESRPEVRWVPENNRHLTLAFLGDVAVSVVENLLGSFDASCGKERSFSLELTRLTRFPKPNSRIIALAGEADSLMNNLAQITSQLLRWITAFKPISSVTMDLDLTTFLASFSLIMFSM